MQPLRGISVLDVGCGGGLFSEALARLGADVTGIDTSATAISVAAAHAQADPAVASRTSYQNVTAEQLQQQGIPASQRCHLALHATCTRVLAPDAMTRPFQVRAPLNTQALEITRSRICPCALAQETHMANAGAEFDAVVASEVIEHVSNIPEFCASLVALTRPGGSTVVSTINRTNRSYAVAIVGAEQIMRLVPKGTHQWERFITPGEHSTFT